MALVSETEDDALSTLSNNIFQAKDYLHLFTLGLRSCYTVNSPSLPAFVTLRDSVAQNGAVYKEKILPLSKYVVETIDSVFTTYEALSFEEWKECLEETIQEVSLYAEQANYVVAIHKQILLDLKHAQDEATRVVEMLKMDSENLEKKAQEEEKDIKAREEWLWLGFIPYVNLVALPIIATLNSNSRNKAVTLSSESEITCAAAKVIKNSLAPSLNGFILALEGFAGFFNKLESKLRSFAKDDDALTKKHYLVMRQYAKRICAMTEAYIDVIPAVETDIESLPDASKFKSYVQRWFEEKQDEQTKTSLLERAKKLFINQKSVKQILYDSGDN